MSEKTPENAVEIIYFLKETIQEMNAKMTGLMASQRMLEQKLNSVLQAARSFEKRLDNVAESNSAESLEVIQAEPIEPDEVMEIRSAAVKKQREPLPLDLKPKPIAPVIPEAPKLIVIPQQNFEVMPMTLPTEPMSANQTMTIVKGKMKDRDVSSGVEVKIFNSNGICIKRTKTSATGEWIAMLAAGEYTAEFSKPGLKPQMKTITILPGRKDIEILI